MNTAFPPRRWLPAALVCAELAWTSVVCAAVGQKQVLVLYSTRRDSQIAIVGERELPRILGDGLEAGLDYYSEYIDDGRFPDPSYQTALRDFLRQKYSGRHFDAVIAMHDLALEFIGTNRDQLFPGAPVVFFSSAPVTRRVANSTGVLGRSDFGSTLALALELQPDLRNVFVVTGIGSGDSGYERMARAQFQKFESRVKVTYLTGLVTKDLEARLAVLPDHSIVYYLVVDRDGAGQLFHPLEYLDRIAAVANAPIYSWVDSAMDHGIVGGSLKNQQAQAEAVGRLALRVLHGEQADSIPITSPDLNVVQVDWRQLQRWGISEARIPVEAHVRFRVPSAWDRYRGYILGAVALLLAQTALIAGLLVQAWRRRQAEERLRGSEAKLRTSYDRIQNLGARLLAAQETERSRIARELHDDISQQMALLEIDLEQLGAPVPDKNVKGLLGEALNRAHGVARSVHELSHRLHPAKLRLIGLVAAMQGLQKELSRSDLSITFAHQDVPQTLPPDLTLSVFRIAQEALQNAVKYSGAHEVSVQLSGTPQGLVLTIADDGVGFDVDGAWNKGLGLISMRERLEAIGGTIAIQSRPGAGTRLEVTVPLGHVATVGA